MLADVSFGPVIEWYEFKTKHVDKNYIHVFYILQSKYSRIYIFLKYCHCHHERPNPLDIEYRAPSRARMGATSGTGTAYPSGAPEFTPSF